MTNLNLKILFLVILFIGLFSCNSNVPENHNSKMYYYNSGEPRMQKYINQDNRKYEGPLVMWHKNGKVALKGTLKNSERHGKFTYFDKAGIENCISFYEKGKKNGEWIYLEKGDTTKIVTYNNGKLVGEIKK